ncbi:hypothetical protein [Parasphingopyxis marina]|uniref:Uncharacterized protein n=1 Tax=Parasphingopyxis marina TaxID=2761622 RepID=A0A842HW47_9SPHN|nr:hypothetical protein [Parasphingopyxis marina]MBC2776581.1 hypothetical protein [Parasphingopyxis marina]
MKKHFLAAAALAALTACGGGEQAATTEAEAPETEAPEMLANGAPAFGSVAAEDIERDETASNRREIAYLSDGSVADIAAFYRAYFGDTGYEIYEGGANFRAEDRDYGGYVQLFDEGERMMVHVSPNVGSGSYDLSENLGDGFPVYPGVPETDYDVNPRPSGSRLVIFRVAADPLDILDFYREAAREAGFEEHNISLAARSEGERVKVGIYNTGERRRVVATVTDLNGG